MKYKTGDLVCVKNGTNKHSVIRIDNAKDFKQVDLMVFENNCLQKVKKSDINFEVIKQGMDYFAHYYVGTGDKRIYIEDKKMKIGRNDTSKELLKKFENNVNIIGKVHIL